MLHAKLQRTFNKNLEFLCIILCILLIDFTQDVPHINRQSSCTFVTCAICLLGLAYYQGQGYCCV
jgi:hypothetical protein